MVSRSTINAVAFLVGFLLMLAAGHASAYWEAIESSVTTAGQGCTRQQACASVSGKTTVTPNTQCPDKAGDVRKYTTQWNSSVGACDVYRVKTTCGSSGPSVYHSRVQLSNNGDPCEDLCESGTSGSQMVGTQRNGGETGCDASGCQVTSEPRDSNSMNWGGVPGDSLTPAYIANTEKTGSFCDGSVSTGTLQNPWDYEETTSDGTEVAIDQNGEDDDCVQFDGESMCGMPGTQCYSVGGESYCVNSASGCVGLSNGGRVCSATQPFDALTNPGVPDDGTGNNVAATPSGQLLDGSDAPAANYYSPDTVNNSTGDVTGPSATPGPTPGPTGTPGPTSSPGPTESPGPDEGECPPGSTCDGEFEGAELDEGVPGFGETMTDMTGRIRNAPIMAAAGSFAGSIPSGGTCPSGSFAAPWGGVVTIDGHCALMEQGGVRATLAAVFLALWAWACYRVFMSA